MSFDLITKKLCFINSIIKDLKEDNKSQIFEKLDTLCNELYNDKNVSVEEWLVISTYVSGIRTGVIFQSLC